MIRDLALLLLSAIGPADEGRALYQFGITERPVLTALPGDVQFTSARPMPCAACHGADGTGAADRVPVPDILHVAATAADARLFQAVLQQGVGSDGRSLRLMPRYALSSRQRAALALYLASLAAGYPPEPGVDPQQVTFDVSAMPQPARAALVSYAVKHPVRIYGRAMVFADAPSRSFAMFSTADAIPEPAADTVPSIRISSPTAQAGRAAFLLTAELLRRTGRRLTRPGFTAAIDALRRQEIEP